MAASSSGALKTHIEALGLSLSAFRDEAPKTPPANYVVIREAISVVPEPAFNPRNDTTGHVSELVQVDLIQQWRNPTTNALTESYTLSDALTKGLHGGTLTGAPKGTFSMTVQGARRLLMREDNKVKTALTVRLRRVL